MPTGIHGLAGSASERSATASFNPLHARDASFGTRRGVAQTGGIRHQARAMKSGDRFVIRKFHVAFSPQRADEKPEPDALRDLIEPGSSMKARTVPAGFGSPPALCVMERCGKLAIRRLKVEGGLD